MIGYELKKIDEKIKEDVFGFIVGFYILNLFFRVVVYFDKFILKRVKFIKNKVEGIICDDISKKYIEKIEICYLIYNEQEVLRNLFIDIWEEFRYFKNVNVLFWCLWGNELSREEKVFNEQVEDYKVFEWFYKKLQILVEIILIL